MTETSNSVEFHIYPAIDVLGGSCVRLLRGDYDAKTEYSVHPKSVAERWLEAGAQWLHVVDLDGAKDGSPTNVSSIEGVVDSAIEMGARVQVGGGIRDYETIARWLDVGVTRCVIGTAALDTGWMEGAVRKFGGDALVVGLDGRDGKMAVRGWVEQTDTSLVDVAERLVAVGVRWSLVTDVGRDGTLTGANVSIAKNIQDVGIAAIASGGVRDLHDVMEAKRAGLAGVIAGRSLYDGTLNLAVALRAVKAVDVC